jgi:catechol 2,3-dioxygenase-like lactoylglutathione lyase family enzyme
MTDKTPISPAPIHHLGFHVPDLADAIDTWVTVFGAGPFYLLEHVAYDECRSDGTPVVYDHSAAFAQCGTVPVELQQTHELRPEHLARALTADGRTAVNHVGVTADDPAAESARLESLGFGLSVYARLGELEFFWHDATEAFGYSIEVISATPELDAFWDTVADGARDWDGRDPIRRL